tara:strand:- start:1 stop:1107 length:1107 start_codon:yes stop_codon:yes gene_type:complete
VNLSTRRILISLRDNPYEVVIGGNALKDIGKELIKNGIKKGTKILIVSNSDVYRPYGEEFISNLKSNGFDVEFLIIEAGESTKNLRTIEIIHDAAYEKRLERGSLMIALGGGVVGDMTGFAAATWLRGIHIIQVPTTLLAMVDASIGGKTGVNHSKGKNLIGAFHQPKLVLIDPYTLRTLPEREFRAGMAEVIKYGVIGDSDLFEVLENAPGLKYLKDLDNNLLEEIIERSTTAKAKIVVQDEKEGGRRAILNYGHTFGHVIENLCGYGKWLHGEAVAIGMVAAGELAFQRGYWTETDRTRQKLLIKKAGLPISWPQIDLNMVFRVLQGDKKVKEGKIRFILPKGIGKVEIIDNVTEEEIKNCLSIVK